MSHFIAELDDYNLVAAAREAGLALEKMERVVWGWKRDGDYAEVSIGALLQRKDGGWVYLTGGCDTTGWDCKASAEFIECSDARSAFGELFVSEEDRNEALEEWGKAAAIHG